MIEKACESERKSVSAEISAGHRSLAAQGSRRSVLM